MKILSENTLLKILQNEEKMEEYLQESVDKPLSIDPVIWQVHLSAPAKKRMPILNRIFQELLKKYSLVFSFLPDHMVLAKVYKILNIPFNVISSKTSMIDLISCRKPTKIARFNRYARIYNTACKTEKYSDLGVYEYTEERSGLFVSYAEFRKECKDKKSCNISPAAILSQLSKSKTKEKLFSNFISSNAQFLMNNFGQSTGMNQRDTNECAAKKTRTISKNTKCSFLKKPTVSPKNSFKIFKSKDRPRLDVQILSKHSAANSPNPAATNERVSFGSYLEAPDSPEQCSLPTSSKTRRETVLTSRTNTEKRSPSCGSPLSNRPKLCIRRTASKNVGETVAVGPMDVENCPKSEEIQTKVDIIAKETAVEQNLNNNESTPINVDKVSGEEPKQLSSGESITVIQQTPVDEVIYTSNSSEPEIVYSSNRSEDDVASIHCSVSRPDLPVVSQHQSVPVCEERNNADYSDRPRGTNFILSSGSEKTSQSSSGHISSERKKTSNVGVTDDFDRLHKRTPLKIERQKSFSSSKKAEVENNLAVDGLGETYETIPPNFEEWQMNGEEEKNEASKSEISYLSSKASPSLVSSLMFGHRSSESESEDVNETNFPAVPSPAVVERDEPIDYIPALPASDLVHISQEKACSQLRNSTPEKPASKMVATSTGKPGFLLKTSTPEYSVSEILSTSSEKLRSPASNSQPVIIIARKGKPRSQSNRPSPEKLISKKVLASQENCRPPSEDSTPEPAALKIVSATNENSHLSSKKSIPEQLVSEIPISSQEKSQPKSEKPTRKKTISLNSAKAVKILKGKPIKKQVKKLTDYVAFSVRKRQVSNFELGESDDQTVSLQKNKSSQMYESTPNSTSIWSPKSHSASSYENRKVRRLFHESENYVSPKLVSEKSPAKVDSSGSRIHKSPSPPKNTNWSELEKICDADVSPKLYTAACYQSREDQKLLMDSEDSLLLSPAKENPSEVDFDGTIRESLLFSEEAGCPENEKNSDSDSGSIILSKGFKSLSLNSKKSSILFPSQSPKMSPSSTRSENILSSPASTALNSPSSTEITLDQVDQMMKEIMPNESTDSDFRFDVPSQFTLKESPHSENYEDKFDASNLSNISALSSSALQKTLTAKESQDEHFVSSSDEEAVLHHNSSNFVSQNTSYPATRSTFNGSLSLSRYSLDIASDEDMKDESLIGKVSDSSSPMRKPSVARNKSKESVSRNFKDSPSTRPQCFSFPVESKSSKHKKELRKKQIDVDIDDSSDEDVFRDDSFKSLPTQLKKKSTSISAQQLRRKYFQDKENQIGRKRNRQASKKVVREKPPLSVAAKSGQLSNLEKKLPISSQKSSQVPDISDDDYDSEELNTALNDSLTQFNQWKENKGVADSDAESTTSQYFDDDIAKLLNDYAALNAEQQPLSISSSSSRRQSTTFMSTWSPKSNSPSFDPKSREPSRKQVTSGTSNYKDVMWNSYPDSLETALTTPDEKLEEVRNNFREKVNNSHSQKLFSSQKSKSSRKTESDSLGFLDWE